MSDAATIPTRRVALGERVALAGRVIAQDDEGSVIRLEVTGQEVDVQRGAGQVLLWTWEEVDDGGSPGARHPEPQREPDPPLSRRERRRRRREQRRGVS